jgi:hypothetical protein
MEIATIGASNPVFWRRLLNDVLSVPAPDGATSALMGPTETRLRKMCPCQTAMGHLSSRFVMVAVRNRRSCSWGDARRGR